MNGIIEFERVLGYRSIPPGQALLPAIPIRLIGPAGRDDVLAVLDTGAEYSIFDGRRATVLGIALTNGKRRRLNTVCGAMDAWLHKITLEIEGSRFRCEVLFSDGYIPRELLGRHTVFDQITIAIREKYHSIYFSPRP